MKCISSLSTAMLLLGTAGLVEAASSTSCEAAPGRGSQLVGTLLDEGGKTRMACILPEAEDDLLAEYVLIANPSLRHRTDVFRLSLREDEWHLDATSQSRKSHRRRTEHSLTLPGETAERLASAFEATVACTPVELESKHDVEYVPMPDGTVQKRIIPQIDGTSFIMLAATASSTCAHSGTSTDDDSRDLYSALSLAVKPADAKP